MEASRNELTFAEELERAIGAVVGFLLSKRETTGWWRDYDFRGYSDEWVTAYVGGAMALAPQAEARESAQRAVDLLAGARGKEGGWKFGPKTPPDADSTAWALRLAAAVGRSAEPWAQHARAHLKEYVRDDGLAVTYIEAYAKNWFDRYPMVPNWDGWCGGHDCVTAAVAGVADLEPRARVLEALRRRQSTSGGWRAYWWVDPEYTAGFACEALSDTRTDDACLFKAAAWAAGRLAIDGAIQTELDPDGSPFATAHALQALSSAPGDAFGSERRRAARWLARRQASDGGFIPSARLRVPFPTMTKPEDQERWSVGGQGLAALGSIVLDGSGIFTAASALRGLLAARRAEQASE